jgi:hypothetical protein
MGANFDHELEVDGNSAYVLTDFFPREKPSGTPEQKAEK